MANTKVKTNLPGYKGPYFPPALERIQHRYQYQAVRWSHLFLEEVADLLHAGAVALQPKTQDGYTWSASITFVHGTVTFIVLFPIARDNIAMTDGTNADRHVALYMSEEVTKSELTYVAKMFADNLVTAYRHMYHAAIKHDKAKALSGE